MKYLILLVHFLFILKSTHTAAANYHHEFSTVPVIALSSLEGGYYQPEDPIYLQSIHELKTYRAKSYCQATGTQLLTFSTLKINSEVLAKVYYPKDDGHCEVEEKAFQLKKQWKYITTNPYSTCLDSVFQYPSLLYGAASLVAIGCSVGLLAVGIYPPVGACTLAASFLSLSGSVIEYHKATETNIEESYLEPEIQLTIRYLRNSSFVPNELFKEILCSDEQQQIPLSENS